LDFGFTILDYCVHSLGAGLGDLRLTILDLFRPNMAGLEPKNNSIFQNPKSKIGTVNFLSRI
jgi:hypothetical protein